MKKVLGYTLLAAGFAATLAAPAGAQTAAPAATPDAKPAHSAPMHGAMRGHEAMRPFSKPTDRVEAKLAYLKTALKITDAQQPQWEAYANLLRSQAAEREKRMAEWHARMMQASGKAEHHHPTVIERMEREQQFYAAGIHRLNEELEVEKPLYAALSRDQQRIADEVLADSRHHGRHEHGHGGEHRGA